MIDARKEKASFDRVFRGKASVIESRIRRSKVVIPDHVERVHRQAFFQILSAGCSSTILPALCPASLLSFLSVRLNIMRQTWPSFPLYPTFSVENSVEADTNRSETKLIDYVNQGMKKNALNTVMGKFTIVYVIPLQ